VSWRSFQIGTTGTDRTLLFAGRPPLRSIMGLIQRVSASGLSRGQGSRLAPLPKPPLLENPAPPFDWKSGITRADGTFRFSP
jgi:hypothetical protein